MNLSTGFSCYCDKCLAILKTFEIKVMSSNKLGFQSRLIIWENIIIDIYIVFSTQVKMNI